MQPTSTGRKRAAETARTEEEAEKYNSWWRTWFDEIPEDVNALPEAHKLTFVDIPPSPRSVPTHEDVRPRDANDPVPVEPWMLKFLDRRVQPELQIAGTSNTFFEAELARFRVLRDGSLEPTTRTGTVSLYPHRWVIAKAAHDADDQAPCLLRLHQVTGDCDQPDVVLSGQVFDHTPQEDVPGLFGTFAV
jgi:hypothetical protein